MAEYEGTSGGDAYAGGAEADTIYGRAGNDTLSGGGDNDYIEGGADDDVIDGGDGNDVLYGGGGGDRLNGGADDDFLQGDAGDDRLTGGAGDDSLRGGEGIDAFDGGSGGSDRANFFETRATQGVTADLRTGQVANDGFGNSETMMGIESLGDGTAFADRFYGNEAINFLGGSRGDTLMAFGGDDRLQINAAPALVDGGAGSDHLRLALWGGLIHDPNGGATAIFAPEMAAGYTIDLAAGTLVDGNGLAGTIAGIERITATALDDVLLGGGASEWFAPGKGSDTIDGRGGVDSLSYAGEHYDYYFERTGGIFVDLAAGQVIETRAEPQITHALPFDGAAPPSGTTGSGSTAESTDTIAGIENVAGTGLGDTLYGDAGNNRIAPGAGNDEVDGRGGIDTVDYSSARAGVNVQLDTGTALEGGTFEKVGALPDSSDPNGSPYGVNVAADDYALTTDQLTGIENAVGSAFADSLVGDSHANRLEGGAGDDVIAGGAGADQLVGGLGNDHYTMDTSDTIVEAANAGTDEVRTAIAAYTLAANVENLTGTSSAGQSLTGNDLANRLAGAGGADQFAGGLGNDVYLVGNGDVVTEAANAGTDEVRTSIAAYTLAANVERLTGTSVGNQALTGNALSNLITGGSGNDVIAGGSGTDQLVGGLGNDLYTMDTSDTVVEAANAGTDEVRTAIAAYTLGANVENLTGTSSGGQSLTGNGLSNLITGGVGNDVLDGGAGNDRLLGGSGGDTLIGGAGADSLKGGAGADVFRYDAAANSTAAAPDLIGDFQVGVDKIGLSAIDANTLAAGDQAFHWIGANAFSGIGAGSAGELRVYQSGSYWWAAGDTNGDGNADLVIALTPQGTILPGQGDFVL